MNISFSEPPKNSTEILERMKEAVACSAEVVIRQARFYNTPIISWENGKIIEVDPFSIKLDDDKN